MKKDIEIIRKKIRKMHLYVLSPDGRLRVTAPYYATNRQIEQFVNSNAEWIEKKQAEVKYRAKQMPSAKEYISGETLMLWGEKHRLELIVSDKGKVQKGEGEILLYAPKNADREQREKLIKAFYRKELSKKAPALISKWEGITSLKCSEWHIKDMKTRWGSCNTAKHRVWLALRLAEFSEECLEYVILHELVHIKIPNHQKEFKDELTKYMPEWRHIEKDILNKKKSS